MEGLSSLEYRGYDSAGIAVLAPNGEPIVHKTSGKLSRLKEALRSGGPD
jgi:glucosamine--fructose-6-phosphate aminotransferase (isomerizing)